MGYSYTLLRPAQVPDKVELGLHAGPRLWTKHFSGWAEALGQQRGTDGGTPLPRSMGLTSAGHGSVLL